MEVTCFSERLDELSWLQWSISQKIELFFYLYLNFSVKWQEMSVITFSPVHFKSLWIMIVSCHLNCLWRLCSYCQRKTKAPYGNICDWILFWICVEIDWLEFRLFKNEWMKEGRKETIIYFLQLLIYILCLWLCVSVLNVWHVRYAR
jgi:hypothetical protein